MAKILKAEMWDKMQYLFRNFYDRMVHCVQYYDGLIDPDVLKRVIVFTTEKVPVLHSSFKSNVIDPYWEVEDYKVGDILTVRESTDLEADINAFICQSIPVESNVQYKMALFNKDGRSVLCMIVNHMCMDGGDFKYFMKKLAENYNKLLDGERDLDIKTGSRSYDQVYSKLTPEEEEVARGLYKNISQVKDEHYFPLTPSSPSDVTRICRRKVGTKLFADFRKIGKALGVTVNDLMLAFYVRSLYEIGMFRDDERLTIPCMVDLRRHIVDGRRAYRAHQSYRVHAVLHREEGRDHQRHPHRGAPFGEKEQGRSLYGVVQPPPSQAGVHHLPLHHQRASHQDRLSQPPHWDVQHRRDGRSRSQNGGREHR